MFKLKNIILLSSFCFVCSSALAHQNASLSQRIDEMMTSIQRECKNPEYLSQYRDLKTYQQKRLKNENETYDYYSDLLDVADFPKLDVNDLCQKVLVKNQIDLADIEQKQREGRSNEAFIDLDLLIYTLLKNLYEDQALSIKDIQKIQVYEQDFLKKFDQNPNDLAMGAIGLSSLIRFFQLNLDYSPSVNQKIYEATLRFNRIFDHIYKSDRYQKFNDDVRFIVPVRLAQFKYTSEEYKLINAIQRSDKELIKASAQNFSKFYDNKQLADQFHKDYQNDTDFDEVIRPWRVANLLTFAFFKLDDLENTKKWIERASLIGVGEEQCYANTLVLDPSLNSFIKNDKVWYQPKLDKQIKDCKLIQKNTEILSKFDYQKLIQNYEKYCDDKYGYKASLLKLKESKFLSDSDFYTTMTLMSDLSDTIEMAEDSSTTNRCVAALKENKAEFLQFYVDHMKPSAFSYQDAKNELKNLK